MKQGLFKMTRSFGRMGDIEGVFIAPIEYVNVLTEGKLVVYFGEILGKHSEVWANFSPEHIKLVTTEESVLNIVSEHGLNSGYNPLKWPVLHSKSEVEIEMFDDMTIQEACEEILKHKA